MKKRRPGVRNPNRTSIGQESLPSRSKSFRELKRLNNSGNGKQIKKINRAQENEEPSIINNKETYDSLDSLFDVKCSLNLPDVESYLQYDQQSSSSSSSATSELESESLSDEISENASTSLLSRYSSNYVDFSHRFNAHYESSERILNRLSLDSLEEKEEDNYLSIEKKEIFKHNSKSDTSVSLAKEELFLEQQEILLAVEEKYNNIMSDQENIAENVATATDNNDKERVDESKNIILSGQPEAEEPDGSKESKSTVDLQTSADDNDNQEEFSLRNSSLTDSKLLHEMTIASDRCNALKAEIAQLQKDAVEMQNKSDLTDEDNQILEGKRQDVMSKMSELEEMTKKIQDLLGLAEPNSDVYTKVIEIIPPDLSLKSTIDGDEAIIKRIQSNQDTTLSLIKKQASKEFPDSDTVDAPKEEYPEDRLPRLIVCGPTDDKIPKIVVADSERRPKVKLIRNIENLTGKLSDAITMQEKLAAENAQLEGGRYKLEEALLEKDDKVDCLQQEVCGLQAKMRLVVKENAELSRQLASLNERITNQVNYRSDYSNYSPVSTFRRSEKSSRCGCSSQEYSGYLQSHTVCESPRDNSPSHYSPRLSGGGSRTYASSPDQTQTMSIRGPTMVATTVNDSSERGTCPADIEDKLNNYENITKLLEQQLDRTESEVQNMKNDLANVKREQKQLEQQKKLLQCTGPCAPCPCTPSGHIQGSPSVLQSASAYQDPQGLMKTFQGPAGSIPSCTGMCALTTMGPNNGPVQQLRDLREQYARLQEDYRNKLTEVSLLRSDAEKMKQETRDAKDRRERAENRLIDLEERLKMYDNERSRFSGSKEHVIEQEQTLMVAKQRYREAQEELEELRSLIQDQANQLEDYRNKYLQAQELVEEQKRQLDLMEMDNSRMNENVTLELGRVKSQFQEKLAELAPLPDILKQTQLKLQECQQLKLVAERNCEELSRELFSCKDRIGTMTSQSEILRSENAVLKGATGAGSDFDNLEDRNRELRNENERMKNALARIEEREAEQQKRVDEKMHEIVQLTSMLEQVREDSARQVARTKERCDTVRRSMQGQISEMEKELAHCRATAKAAQKDRDEIRQKMQKQINQLNEAFEQAQGRVRNLQGHVSYLRTSYTNIFSSGGQGDRQANSLPSEITPNPYDACDCNH